MTPDVKAYTAVMQEIKRRTSLARALHARELTVHHKATHVESMVLQIRMILELIALGALAAHRSLFEEQQKKFASHWEPLRILRDLEKLNPSFYPQPVVEKTSSIPGVVNDLEDLRSGFLTRDELIEIHGRCGNVLHARNPYGKPLDYALYERAVPNWLNQIIALLNCHKIHMHGDDSRFYLVHMHEARDDSVRMYTFARDSGSSPRPKGSAV